MKVIFRYQSNAIRRKNVVIHLHKTYTLKVKQLIKNTRTTYWCSAGIFRQKHYIDVIMSAMASQITSLTIVYSIVYSGTEQRKHQSSALLAFVWGIYRRPVNSMHKGPVTRKMFPFDDVIMNTPITWLLVSPDNQQPNGTKPFTPS